MGSAIDLVLGARYIVTEAGDDELLGCDALAVLFVAVLAHAPSGDELVALMKSSDSFFGCAPEGTHVVEGGVERRETCVRGPLRMLYAEPPVKPRGADFGVGQTGPGRDEACDGLRGVGGQVATLIWWGGPRRWW